MTERIDSAQNDLLKLVRKTMTRKGREKEGLFLCEGWRAAREAWKAGIQPVAVLLSEDATQEEQQAVAPLVEAGGDLRMVRSDLFRTLTETVTPQHVLMLGRMVRRQWTDFAGTGPVLVIDRIQDPGNLGTILRTCAAAGLSDVVLLPGTVDFYSPKVLRSSAGGIYHLRIWPGPGPAELIRDLEARGYQLICADVGGDRSVFEMVVPARTALVIGNEGAGIHPEILGAAAQRVTIPMPGGVESLNASVAAGILIYELLRKGALAQSGGL